MNKSDKHLLRLGAVIVSIIIFAFSLNHILESGQDNSGVIMGIVGIIASPIIGIVIWKWSNSY